MIGVQKSYIVVRHSFQSQELPTFCCSRDSMEKNGNSSQRSHDKAWNSLRVSIQPLPHGLQEDVGRMDVISFVVGMTKVAKESRKLWAGRDYYNYCVSIQLNSCTIHHVIFSCMDTRRKRKVVLWIPAPFTPLIACRVVKWFLSQIKENVCDS